MSRRWLLLVVCLLLAGCKDPQPAPSASRSAGGLPSSMVALGDSVTAGYAACVALAACPRSSWSTGDAIAGSHYRRILDANPAIRGRARNLAVPGALAADLAAQVRQAGSGAADYVTVLIGANDACRATIGAMTPVDVFRSTVDKALTDLRTALPAARVLVVSIPDIARIWAVGHANAAVRRVWSQGVCPALLANPESTAQPDVDRRAAFRARIDAYNVQLEGACARYGRKCRTDGGAVHAATFGLSLLAVADFFHPNGDGQAQIAKVSYPGRFTW